MFQAVKCKQCGQQFFSFSEDALRNMLENHFMSKGHTETQELNIYEEVF